jgi:hypothetical protein
VEISSSVPKTFSELYAHLPEKVNRDKQISTEIVCSNASGGRGERIEIERSMRHDESASSVDRSRASDHAADEAAARRRSRRYYGLI